MQNLLSMRKRQVLRIDERILALFFELFYYFYITFIFFIFFHYFVNLFTYNGAHHFIKSYSIILASNIFKY